MGAELGIGLDIEFGLEGIVLFEGDEAAGED